MKALILILILIAVLTGCNKSNTNDCLTLIIDKTDTMKAVSELTGNQIFQYLKVSKDEHAGAIINIAPVTDLRFNKSYSLSIPSTDVWNSNELERKSELKSFGLGIDSCINLVKKKPIGINGSAIFETLTMEINKLADCKNCGSRSIILISDLREYSSLMNTYDSVHFVKFMASPDSFYELMNKECLIQKGTNGMTVTIIHQPRTIKEDRVFYQVSNLLTSYLRSKGIMVKIETSL